MPKCKHCKEPYKKERINQIVCSPECAYKLQSKAKDKKEKEETKVKKEKLKTYTQKVNDAKKVFQKWIRNRDKDLPCISCGSTISNPCWDAGHYKKAELYRGVIFNENNAWKQCRKCNFFLDGNELNYRQGLIKRIGLCEVINLDNLAEQTRKYKYSDAELDSIKKQYKL